MPQRFLRPGITTSIRFNALDWQCQSFYVRLLTLVDDFGRYDAEPRLLRSHVFPLGDQTGKDVSVLRISQICETLAKVGLVVFYQELQSDKKTLQILRWQEKPRAQHSRYPELLEDCKQMFSGCEQMLPSLVPRSSPSPSSSTVPSNGSEEPSRPQVNKNLAYPHGITDSEWIATLKADKTYSGIDIDREHGKMMAWCNTNEKNPSRRRFVNWLNRAEKPMSPQTKPQRKELPFSPL